MESMVKSAKTVPLCFHVPLEKREAVISAVKEYGGILEEDEDLESVTLEEVSPGEALQGFRIHKGLTQVQLAQLTGISQRHISAMENGKLPIGKIRAKRFADIFGADYRVFL